MRHRASSPPRRRFSLSMRQSARSFRTIISPVLVGLQALIIASCEPSQPVQPPLSPDGLTTSTEFNVYHSTADITITATDSSLSAGQQMQATAMAHNSYGTDLPSTPIAWAISPTQVATISSTGVIVGVSAGNAVVSASADGVTRTLSISVTSASTPSAPVHMVQITANSKTLELGESTQVSGVDKDINSTPISGVPITWWTSPTSVATVASTGLTSGLLTAKGVGTVT